MRGDVGEVWISLPTRALTVLGRIGVRMPADAVCHSTLAQLDEPLLCSSVPVNEEVGEQLVCDAAAIGDSWCNEVDFVIDAGERPLDGSTVYDLADNEPILVRLGIGRTIDF